MQDVRPTIKAPKATDIDNCGREPIHIPGAIQPHGVLLVIDPNNGFILQISENCREHLGRSAEAVLGKPVQTLMPADSDGLLRQALKSDDLRKANPITLSIHTSDGLRYFDGILHRTEGGVVLELEPKSDHVSIDFPSYYHSVRESILTLQNTRTIQQACEAIVHQIRRLSGYDRVDLYKFDEEWNGNVLAESRDLSMDSYLDQRFPAGDIPAQARTLYTLNWIRLIVDANYQPSPIVPAINPRSAKALDLSFSTLRSVSPVHLEYLRNMPTLSSMSISIMKEDRLWGLICCHHATPRFVSYETRSSCELLGQIFSYHLTALESNEEILRRQELRGIVQQIEKRSREHDDIHEVFAQSSDLILQLTHATGAALILQNKLTSVGIIPERDELVQLIRHLRAQPQQEYFASHELTREIPEWERLKKIAAGVLAIKLSDTFDSYILWFRPEFVQTIRWAGNPNKKGHPQERISPRQSFELWLERVNGVSEPFSSVMIETALELRNAILLNQLSRVNADLRLSNNELDEFAQIISHDLREPLRGIRSYASFVLEDESKALSSQTQARLSSIVGLSHHMDGLTTSLFQYARLGRYHMAIESTDIAEVLEGVIFRLRNLIDEENATIEIPRAFPRISCSPVRVGEIYYNLISNAIKYNSSERKTITLSYIERQDDKAAIPVFTVQDNGIGIDPSYHQTVFKIFRRLHRQSAFGGGTGAGLAIVKKLVESHHGHIWIESALGQGSTFFFTLQPDTHALSPLS